MTAIDPLVESNRERADAAAEAESGIADASVDLGMKLDQRGYGQPQILDAAAEDIALRRVDAVEHMPCRIAGDRRTSAAREAAKAGKQHRGFLDRNVEIRLVASAVAMADDEAAPDDSLSRQQQPTADRKFVGRGEQDVVNAPLRMAALAFAASRSRIDAERADVARPPELIEPGRRLWRSDRAKFIDAEAVSRIEGIGVVRRKAHETLFS